MGVEESPVLEFADTIKLSVVDNDDTYAMDEVRHSRHVICCSCCG